MVCATTVGAAEETPDGATTELDTLVVSATRTERPLRETAGSVTVIDDEQMQEMLVQDISDLVRYEPGVVVTTDATRFGLGGFEIRGIGGNRVLTEIDGVPLSDAFAIGSFASAGRNFVDPEMLKRVEILRGSASALYGSDALGGVVAFSTKDPVDYLRDESGFVAAKLGYNADDQSTVGTVIGALGDARNGWLFAYTRRDGRALDNQGSLASNDSTRTAPNPQDYRSDNVLAKGVFARESDTFRIVFDAHDSAADTDVISSRATQDHSATYGMPYFVTTEDLRGEDSARRLRVSGEWSFERDAALFDAGSVQVYAQRGDTEQVTDELRTTTVFGVPMSVTRHRIFDFEQDLIGTNVMFRKAFDSDTGADHLLVYGIEIERTATAQMRDGVQTDLATGERTHVIMPDAFPVRDFPESTTLEAGLYVQDEVQWDAFTLIPGLRVDHYRLNPDENDPVFVADNPGITPVDLDETHVSPKLGALYDFNDAWTGFFQYAQGFRAPPYNDVNVGFTNFAFGYTAIPNPDLESETSDHYEIGVRRHGERSAMSIVAFRNRYDDFIEPFASLGVDPQTGLLVFQSRNLNAVTTEGIELKAHYDLASVQGLRVIASLAYADGKNDDSGEPLNSIAPPTAVLGADYEAASGDWGLELIGTFVGEKDEVDETAGALFTPSGYAKFDLLGWYAFTPDVKLHAGVFNLTNATYWPWASVRGRPADDAAIARYTAPGVNASIALRIAF